MSVKIACGVYRGKATIYLVQPIFVSPRDRIRPQKWIFLLEGMDPLILSREARTLEMPVRLFRRGSNEARSINQSNLNGQFVYF